MPEYVGRFSMAPHDWDHPFKHITAASKGHAYALRTPEIGQTVHLDGRKQSFTH